MDDHQWEDQDEMNMGIASVFFDYSMENEKGKKVRKVIPEEEIFPFFDIFQINPENLPPPPKKPQ